MALKDTIEQFNDLLEEIVRDLTKAEKGNKSAAQRVRTRSIHLEKVAKMYRKESLITEKKPAKIVKKNKTKPALEVADVFIKRPTAKILTKKR